MRDGPLLTAAAPEPRHLGLEGSSPTPAAPSAAPAFPGAYAAVAHRKGLRSAGRGRPPRDLSGSGRFRRHGAAATRGAAAQRQPPNPLRGRFARLRRPGLRALPSRWAHWAGEERWDPLWLLVPTSQFPKSDGGRRAAVGAGTVAGMTRRTGQPPPARFRRAAAKCAAKLRRTGPSCAARAGTRRWKSRCGGTCTRCAPSSWPSRARSGPATRLGRKGRWRSRRSTTPGCSGTWASAPWCPAVPPLSITSSDFGLPQKLPPPAPTCSWGRDRGTGACTGLLRRVAGVELGTLPSCPRVPCALDTFPRPLGYWCAPLFWCPLAQRRCSKSLSAPP